MKKSFSVRILIAAVALAVFQASPGLPALRADPVGVAPEKRSTDYSNILPADDTAGIVVIQNFFKPATFDAGTPVARLLDHPAVKQWTGDLLPKMLSESGELRDALGLTGRDLPRLFTGKAVLAAIIVRKKDAKADVAAENAGEGKHVVKIRSKLYGEELGIVEFRGSSAEYEALTDKFEAYLKSKDAKTDISRERAEGLLVHAYETDAALLGGEAGSRIKLFHAMRDGAIVLSRDKSRLLDTVRSLARGAAENPLSGRPDFIAVKKEMGSNDGFFLANLATVMPLANEMLKATLEDQGEANPQMKTLLDPDTVVRGLALDNFSSLYGSLAIDEKRIEVRYGLTWKDRSGVASLINFGQEAVKIPEYVSSEYKGLDVSTVDFPATLDAGIALFKAISPGGYGMGNMLLAAKPETEKLLTTLRKGVLDNLKPELVSLTGYASPDPAEDEEPGKVWVLSLRDPAAAQAAIDAVYTMEKGPDGKPTVQPETREYLGVKICKLPEMPSPFVVDVATNPDDAKVASPRTMRVSYAFVGDRFVISAGPDPLVEGIVANMKNPGKSLADGRFADALGELPGTPCSVSYGDIATYLKTAITETLRSGKHRKAGLSDDDLKKARTAAADLKYFWAAKAFYDKSGVYGRLVVAEQAGSGK